MGLGESNPLIDNESAIACSICLEIVAVGGDRSTAKLQCGHEFHLDCIGSAFNSKGLMQCPNCRSIEKGKWFYANGSCSPPELSFDEWTHDEDLYDLSYSELSFGVHWCLFGRIARVPSSFGEDESSPAFAFQDLLRYHGNTDTLLAADPCPYLAYLQPLQISSSSNPHISYEIPLDNWNRTSFLGYGSRLAGSYVSSSPPYLASARPQYQHRNPYFPGLRQSVATSGLPPVGPTLVSLPDQTRYYLFPPATASSSRSLQDNESMGSWERDQYAPFSLMPVERESAWWGSYHRLSSSPESGFWHRYGSSEHPASQWRTEASSHRPPHGHVISRTRP